MAETHGFYRLPPDGAGKRVPASVMLEFDFNTLTGTLAVGDTLAFATSSFGGVVLEVSAGTSGKIHMLMHDPVPANPALVLGEDVIINGTPVAKVGSVGYPFMFSQGVISGGNNPLNTMHVDNVGAANVRFAEGSPQFDAFGKMQVSQSTTLGDYVLRYDSMLGQFQDIPVGTASLVHSQLYSGVLMSTGTSPGDKMQRTSHEYHCYQPGVSHVIETTVALGDNGKTNVTRNWGYFDDDNGLFFQLAGTQGAVVNRSKASGSVIDEIIPREQWNGDRLDGSGGIYNISGHQVDLTKDNIYWIDLQWLGAGRVRFGVVINGVRITCHADQNANVNPFSYMSTGSLPIRAEQFNTGISASSSEMKFFCSTVKTEGAFTPLRRVNAAETPALISVTSNSTPVTAMMLRPAETFKGIANRCAIYPQTFEVYNAGPDPVVFEATRNATELSGVYQSVDTGSAAEISLDGVTVGGRVLRSRVIPANASVTVDFESFKNGRQGLRRNAVHTSGYSGQCYRFRTLAPGKTASVHFAAHWEEVQK